MRYRDWGLFCTTVSKTDDPTSLKMTVQLRDNVTDTKIMGIQWECFKEFASDLVDVAGTVRIESGRHWPPSRSVLCLSM